MKKKLIFILGILLFFGFAAVNCTAQSTNNEQRIVGTWVDEADGSTTTFNANGTGSSSTGGAFKYGIAGNKVAMVVSDGRSSMTIVADFYISSDGKTLIVSASGGSGSLLRKKT